MALKNNYCNFSGRSSRSEFWWFILFYSLLIFVIALIFGKNDFGQTISGLVVLALILPYFGLCVRRLHDIGRSGWWLLINLIPFVGEIIYIIWMCKDSEMHPNQYGPVPNVVA
ncbi:MAG: DUF805 domain-containing protein [Muribaculaceae bacterium]|nr:DUF805 domain-containing protein [Muribaculaceae bacterium]